MQNINFIGLHFHIGSQILDMTDFVSLCNRINDIQSQLEQQNIKIKITENRVYLLSVLIITSVFLICLLIAERYPFGTLPAIKGDRA